jgi:hypothetical protein
VGGFRSSSYRLHPDKVSGTKQQLLVDIFLVKEAHHEGRFGGERRQIEEGRQAERRDTARKGRQGLTHQLIRERRTGRQSSAWSRQPGSTEARRACESSG